MKLGSLNIGLRGFILLKIIFFSYGFLIGSHPKAFIFTSVLLAIVSGLGMILWNNVTDVNELWTPYGSKVRHTNSVFHFKIFLTLSMACYTNYKYSKQITRNILFYKDKSQLGC